MTKKVGIMQPYFMPYIGYWQLLNAVDEYVIYDDVNFIKVLLFGACLTHIKFDILSQLELN